jgi:hypothetical protein
VTAARDGCSLSILNFIRNYLGPPRHKKNPVSTETALAHSILTSAALAVISSEKARIKKMAYIYVS